MNSGPTTNYALTIIAATVMEWLLKGFVTAPDGLT